MIFELRIQQLDIVDFNDPRCIPCQQSYEQCDQVATLHIVGPDDEWDVDVCEEHAGFVLREFNAHGRE